VACNHSEEAVALSLNDFAEIKYSRNMTLMVIWTCVIYIIGGLPRNVYIIIKYLREASRYYTFSLITFFILIYSNGFSIFVYYLFNNIFRQILDRYFNKICFFRRNIIE
jgi:hypothetical protein